MVALKKGQWWHWSGLMVALKSQRWVNGGIEKGQLEALVRVSGIGQGQWGIEKGQWWHWSGLMVALKKSMVGEWGY